MNSENMFKMKKKKKKKKNDFSLSRDCGRPRD